MHKPWIVLAAATGKAEMHLLGTIGDEVTALAFLTELKDLARTHANIDLHVNSCGGSIFDGFAIYNGIRSSQAAIDCYIDGMCASMATIVALACRRIYMSKVATFMTHRASAGARGTADDLRAMAEMVDTVEDSVANVYARRTGLDKEAARKKYMGTEDRWLSAQQALDEKLIDGIYDIEAAAVELPTGATPEVAHSLYMLALQHTPTSHQTNPTPDMSKVLLSMTAFAALGITNAAADGVDTAMLETKISELNMRATTAETAKAKAETELRELQASTKDADVTAQLKAALGAGKLTVELSGVFATQYAGKPEELKAVLAALPTYVPVTDKLTSDPAGELPVQLKGKTYDELHMSGGLATVKKDFPEHYKQLFKDKFGKEPAQ